jgi:Protein of unknown function, DUF547
MIRFALLVLLALWAPQPVGAAPAAELWARWAQHDPSSTIRVDHRRWGRFLAAYLQPGEHGLNRVAYGSVTAEGRADLTAYLAMLEAVPVSTLNRHEQMAFWINLYNALTVRVVLDHYPVASIRDIDISPGLFSNGPWRATLIAVEGEPLSLDDIEHRILRPIWRDPRVHYAVNCASVGCPSLQAEPFEARELDRMLDMAAIGFVNSPRGVRLGDDGLWVSSIYAWFEEDFGGDEAGVIRHLMAYASPGLAMRLQKLDGIAGHGYDWTLNDAAQEGR